MEHFSQNPHQGTYDKITALDSSLDFRNDFPYRMFKLKARERWSLLPAVKDSEKRELDQLETRLLHPENQLTAKDLDTLWALFYATGSNLYPDRIKSVFDGKEIATPVQKAALWSYTSHVMKGLLQQ